MHLLITQLPVIRLPGFDLSTMTNTVAIAIGGLPIISPGSQAYPLDNDKEVIVTSSPANHIFSSDLVTPKKEKQKKMAAIKYCSN